VSETITAASPSLQEQWRIAWPKALASWSAYTMLREPVFLESDTEAKGEGMAGQIAAIRLVDQIVMVNLETIRSQQLEDAALPILAHEIGHHVYVPGNLADNARMLAAIKPVLFGLPEDTANLVANLYGDLLINDRLQRRASIDVAGVYRKLRSAQPAQDANRVWKVYMHTYEQLWRLAPGTLAPPGVTPEMTADAVLIARLIRRHAADWLSGTRRFACILYPYLQEDAQEKKAQTFSVLGLADTRRAGCCRGGGESDADAIPGGIIAIDPAELGGDSDFDAELDDLLGDGEDETIKDNEQSHRGQAGERLKKPKNTQPTRQGSGTPQQQFREPFEYGQLLRALGLDLKDHEITTRYYRERALPYLIPFPVRRAPQAKEPLPEGHDTWEPADDLDELDVFGSLLQSPVVVPGVTTVLRVYGDTPGSNPAKVPLDLDTYVDCSGSMPNPAVNVSYLALAATILALSALRAGARVQATLWSGTGQFDTTGAFLRDEKRILGIITGYIAGATGFPLHVLASTYEKRKPSEPPAHIVVISDEGVDTLLANDDKGTPGESICRMALKEGRGGGTLVLNLSDPAWKPREKLESIGFNVHAVSDWEQLVAFARAFVRENYE
jgi:hypothetical protein